MNLFEEQHNEFQHRHIGPDENETTEMLKVIGRSSLDELIEPTIPADIRLPHSLNIPQPQSELRYLHELKEIASKNKVKQSH